MTEDAECAPPDKEVRILGRKSMVSGDLGASQVDVDPYEAVLGGCDSAIARTRYASVRGYSHRQYAEPREDAIRCGLTATGNHVVAIADGVGSAARAAAGAQHLVDEAVVRLQALDFEDGIWHPRLLSDLAESLRRRAAAEEFPPEEFASTLLLAVLEEGQEGTRARLVSVGDCGAAVYPAQFQRERPSGLLEVKTSAMPTSFESAVISEFVVLNGELLLIGSDGWMNLSERGPLEPLLLEWCAGLPQSLGRFLWDVDAVIRTFDDDRTVYAYRRHDDTSEGPADDS